MSPPRGERGPAPLRIGILASLSTANSVYRALPLLELQRRGHVIRLGMDGKRPRHDALHGCDVVHIYRDGEREIQRLARELRAAGTAIVWDNDDDLADVPGERRRDAMRSQEARSEMQAMIRLADVVTTPSRLLASRYREWGAAHAEVVENHLPAEWAPGEPPLPREGLTLGWTAAKEHRFDFDHFGLRAVLQDLLARHPALHVACVGIDLGLASDRYRHIPILQYEDLPHRVATFDVGIAPIADIPFNHARSNVKVKEYAGLGVPWLASPTGPYVGLGPKQGGLLVPDDGWPAALERLVTDARLRAKLAKRGRKWAAGETVIANLTRWERVLALAVAQARLARAS